MIYPLLNAEEIRKRREAVAELLENLSDREDFMEALGKVGDLERLISTYCLSTDKILAYRLGNHIKLTELKTIGIEGNLTIPPLPHRHAFGSGSRHADFGPFASSASGFTLAPLAKGQLQLVILPFCPHELAVLLILPVPF